MRFNSAFKGLRASNRVCANYYTGAAGWV